MQVWPWISIVATLAVSLGVDLFVRRRGGGNSRRSAGVWTGIASWVSMLVSASCVGLSVWVSVRSVSRNRRRRVVPSAP